MQIYSSTDIGLQRKLNEDYYDNYVTDDFALMVVADGMGGHNAGEIASELAVKSFIYFFKENLDKFDNYQDLIKECISYSNGIIYDESHNNEDLLNMGTTIVVALVKGNSLYIANVGDSRAYFLNEYGFRQLSKDHSLVNDLLLSGTITEEEARNYVQKNVITKSLGAEEKVEPEMLAIDIEKNDMVLLCTDGLNGMLEDFEIQEILKKDLTLEEKVNELIDLSLDRGGFDNITISLLEIEEESKQ
ncbi:Stp1/IreP family PP2C-type Ser/Thr phosphatase [Miniphocaeibacter massiliensis]|uniref:Stp1/IreP family PP2C-type Ser/Thr phosphatase n=1 Tax=Miniphocaeibacter massiliensis TaxID=2041841 RepID=UPI000C080A05|nr:Stp1/IreP family PP2C-type Ser/Thr phosphatase [Miniphocaeibacter massiliensis]